VPGRDDWIDAARAADDDELRERILTGFKSGKPFIPYQPTVRLPPTPGAVLDFGCGVGRNFAWLSTIAGSVTGFDLPPMIARCRRLAAVAVDALEDDWSRVRLRRFDLIFASLVLQHIETATCRAYLADFARMAPLLYLLTRVDTDFGENLLRLVEDTGTFDAPDCVEVEHDPSTHQLKVLRTVPFEQAARSAGHEHYEVLLQVRPTRPGGI